MRAVVWSLIAAATLYGANDPQMIINEVSKLRQKYDECRQEQMSQSGSGGASKLKAQQVRINNLQLQLDQGNKELLLTKKQKNELEREIAQKNGVIQSLEKTLKSRDKGYREAVAENERLMSQTNSAKVSRIERQNLTASLEKAKFEVERLESLLGKISKEKLNLEKQLSESRLQADKYKHIVDKPAQKIAEPIKAPQTAPDQTGKIKALQTELARANEYIRKLQTTPKTPVVQEKIVTKVVEPTEKITALQKELSSAQATIANLKKNSKVVIQEKIVEKVVYKERPIIQEKVVTKVVEPTEKIASLQRELASAQAKLLNLKNSPSNTIVKEKIVEKVVYKDRPVIQEKIVEKVVYKDRPVIQEKTVVKSNDATEKLNRALQQKLAENEAKMAKLKEQSRNLTPPKSVKTAAANTVNQDKALKAGQNIQMKPAMEQAGTSTPKKSGPSAYRMASNAPVYNAPGGSVVDTWEARRSFTSGTTVNGWIKITGYFVNRVWQRADEDLWVKESDVIRR